MAHDRFLISLGLALVIHLLLFLILQLIVKLEESRIPEYSGPLFVQIEEVPVITQSVKREPPVIGEEEKPPIGVKEDVVQRPLQEYVPEEPSEPAPGVQAVRDKEIPYREELFQRPSIEEVFRRTQPLSETTPLAERQPDETSLPFPSYEGPEEPLEEAGAPEEEAMLDLGRLDSAIARRNGSAESIKEDEAAPAVEAGEGIVIQWDDPAEGREPISMPRPDIPEWVKRKGLLLTVTVSFILAPQGILSGVTVEESSGYTDVDEAVLNAVRRWKFMPVVSTRNVRGRVPYVISPR